MPPVEVPPDTVVRLRTRPGVRRDGTVLDSQFYNDAAWVRFQRGLPRKIGGYKLISNAVLGVPRNVYVSAGFKAHVFTTAGVDQVTFDVNGGGGTIAARATTPALTEDTKRLWQSASLFDASGSGQMLLFASETLDAEDIGSDAEGSIFYGDVSTNAAMVELEDGSGPILTSGGICVLQPFLFVYGNNGLIRNSNANDVSIATGWSGSLANAANVAATKIVKGLPMRGGGQSPAGLFWSLDSLIRVTFVDGTTKWRYDTVSDAISVLCKNGIVERDGIYFWPGVDRFFMYNGTVQELPNDMNQNFFFDNINWQHANKTFAFKVPRFGEIWWVFPFGDSTEPNHAIIFNVRENCWYDTPISRSTGTPPQVFRAPLLAGGDRRDGQVLTVSTSSGAPAVGQSWFGTTSGARGIVVRNEGSNFYVAPLNDVEFVAGEPVTVFNVPTTIFAGSVLTAAAVVLDAFWMHETGVDRVYLGEAQAIQSYVETDRFDFMTGGPGGQAPGGPGVQTRLSRIEPDFVQSGAMTVTVRGTSYANSVVVDSEPFAFSDTTEKIDIREQRREISLRFESNQVGGDFQMGKVFVTLAPGDARG